MTKPKLFWLDLVKRSACHKKTTWELAIMTFPPKTMSKNLGVCTDSTLSTVKHIDHISHSAYLEIRRISSTRHLLTTKATAQLVFFCSQSVGLLQLFASLTSSGIRCTGCKKFKTMQRRWFFTRADMSMLDYCSWHFTVCQSRTGLFLR